VARAKPLDFVVLGLLMERPSHGYALKRALSPALPRERLLNDGILYPLLDRLERDKLIRKKTREVEGAPARNEFHVTAAGRRAFLAWLESEEHEDDEVTYDFFVGHPFLAKCMFFALLPEPALQAKLQAQRHAVQSKLATFDRIRSGMVERGVDPFRIAILDLGIEQTRAKQRWLDRLLEEKGCAS
jgi:DNA-binding PadR family transcriptional regulator